MRPHGRNVSGPLRKPPLRLALDHDQPPPPVSIRHRALDAAGRSLLRFVIQVAPVQRITWVGGRRGALEGTARRADHTGAAKCVTGQTESRSRDALR